VFCERPFALHCQQPEKDQQNVDVATQENILRTRHVTKCDKGNNSLKLSIRLRLSGGQFGFDKDKKDARTIGT